MRVFANQRFWTVPMGAIQAQVGHQLEALVEVVRRIRVGKVALGDQVQPQLDHRGLFDDQPR